MRVASTGCRRSMKLLTRRENAQPIWANRQFKTSNLILKSLSRRKTKKKVKLLQSMLARKINTIRSLKFSKIRKVQKLL